MEAAVLRYPAFLPAPPPDPGSPGVLTRRLFVAARQSAWWRHVAGHRFHVEKRVMRGFRVPAPARGMLRRLSFRRRALPEGGRGVGRGLCSWFSVAVPLRSPCFIPLCARKVSPEMIRLTASPGSCLIGRDGIIPEETSRAHKEMRQGLRKGVAIRSQDHSLLPPPPPFRQGTGEEVCEADIRRPLGERARQTALLSLRAPLFCQG